MAGQLKAGTRVLVSEANRRYYGYIDGPLEIGKPLLELVEGAVPPMKRQVTPIGYLVAFEYDGHQAFVQTKNLEPVSDDDHGRGLERIGWKP